MLEFTEYISSLYPTIKFELVYSANSLNILDLTLRLIDGYINCDVYSKPTNDHLYLPYSSPHRLHSKKAIPYGVALRLKRNCSKKILKGRCDEYKTYLIRQNYHTRLVNREFERVLEVGWADLLTPGSKEIKRKVFPFVADYNPRLPKKHVDSLCSFPALEEVFPPKSIILAFRRGKNLKEIIAPSNLKTQTDLLLPSLQGSFKCKKKCDLCQHFLLESTVKLLKAL